MRQNSTLSTQSEIRRILIRRAKSQKLITYAELTALLRTTRLIPNSRFLSELLTRISIGEDSAGRGLLSAVVVTKRHGIPGIGFFTKLGARVRRTEFRRRWIKDLAKVYAAWK